MTRKNFFYWLEIFCLILIVSFILLPLISLIFSTPLTALFSSIKEKEVLKALALSLYVSGLSALIVLLFGTPLAYFLVREDFPGKKLVESILDLPVVIPHPLVGIAFLTLVGSDHPLGRALAGLGIKMVGTVSGIVLVLVFVAFPVYLNLAKSGFLSVPPRLEKVSRSLGAGAFATFGRITLPLAGRSLLSGVIMAMARALSEFGSVIVIAYHPMIAPVLIFERFESYGLAAARPVAVWLILISLLLFLLLRILAFSPSEKKANA